MAANVEKYSLRLYLVLSSRTISIFAIALSFLLFIRNARITFEISCGQVIVIHKQTHLMEDSIHKFGIDISLQDAGKLFRL